eukprot:364251-Chlamydomonas_euryale.AAC.3
MFCEERKLLCGRKRGGGGGGGGAPAPKTAMMCAMAAMRLPCPCARAPVGAALGLRAARRPRSGCSRRAS